MLIVQVSLPHNRTGRASLIRVLQTKVMRISRQQSSIQFIKTQKQLEIVEYYKFFGSMIKNDDNVHVKLNSIIVITIAAFNQKKALFASRLGSNLREKLEKRYIWNVAWYGAETWTLRTVDEKYLESFEMWCFRRMENLIFVVPCIMLNSEINPTRCNNCVYSSQWLYSTYFGWQFHPSSGVHMLYYGLR